MEGILIALIVNAAGIIAQLVQGVVTLRNSRKMSAKIDQNAQLTTTATQKIEDNTLITINTAKEVQDEARMVASKASIAATAVATKADVAAEKAEVAAERIEKSLNGQLVRSIQDAVTAAMLQFTPRMDKVEQKVDELTILVKTRV
jgi:hypothetical protein